MTEKIKNDITKANEKLINLINERKKLVEEKNKLLIELLNNSNSLESDKSKKLLETDFKTLFNKDNDDIRKSFIRKECKNSIEKNEKIENEIEIIKNKISQIDEELKVYKMIFNGSIKLLEIEGGLMYFDSL